MTRIGEQEVFHATLIIDSTNLRSGSIFVSLWKSHSGIRENVWEPLKLGLISGYDSTNGVVLLAGEVSLSHALQRNQYKTLTSVYQPQAYAKQVRVLWKKWNNKQTLACLYFIILVPVLSMLVINTRQSFVLASIVELPPLVESLTSNVYEVQMQETTNNI